MPHWIAGPVLTACGLFIIYLSLNGMPAHVLVDGVRRSLWDRFARPARAETPGRAFRSLVAPARAAGLLMYLAVGAVLGGVVGYWLGSAGADAPAPLGQAASSSAVNALALSPTPPATATSVPALAGTRPCQAIAGSEYESEVERAWYLANCVAPAAKPAPVPVSGAPN